jgi:hypothetical protein
VPLLDHFRPPLTPRRHCQSFHSAWAGSIADALNRDLPPGYFAEERGQAAGRLEVDVGTFDEEGAEEQGGGVATARPSVWTAPPPTLTMPGLAPDHFEVRVFQEEGGSELVAAVELISPANKDRTDERRAFAAKCVSALCQGVGLIVIDVVTSRHANLHNEMVALLERPQDFNLAADVALYAVAYRPVLRQGGEQIEMWPHALALGQALPVLPLALGQRGPTLPLDLEATYTDARRRRRLADGDGSHPVQG